MLHVQCVTLDRKEKVNFTPQHRHKTSPVLSPGRGKKNVGEVQCKAFSVIDVTISSLHPPAFFENAGSERTMNAQAE